VQSFATLPAVIGFTYNSDGQLVRPVTQADTGAQAGPGFAKLGRQHRASALNSMARSTARSRSVQISPSSIRPSCDIRTTCPTPYQQQWSGIWRDNVNSIIDFDGMICWRISRPLSGLRDGCRRI
jgi:hypothetical protein